MEDSNDLAIALEILNRKIAELNLQIIHGNYQEEMKLKLGEYLAIKEKLSNGNMTLIN